MENKDATVVVIDGAGSTHWYGKENQTIYEVFDGCATTLEKTLVGRVLIKNQIIKF